MQVVQRSPAFRHKFLANADRERQIGEALPVEMPNLPVADVEEHHAVRMHVYTDLRPRSHFALNPAGDRLPNHSI